MPEARARGRAVPLVVAVTGGIGAGKTSFCEVLAALPGVRVLDADVVVHRALDEDEEVARRVRERFGPQVLDAAGRVDRARLAEMVFREADARRDLEAIVHPVVRAELARAADRLRRTEGVVIVLVQIPLLAESGVPDGYDRVVTIEADPDVRRERARRRGLDTAEVARRMAAQASEAQRRAIADDVVVNDGDRAHLAAAARRLYQEWRRMQEGGGG